MATCSHGTTVDYRKALTSGLKKLRRLDEAMARSRNVHGRHDYFHRRERLQARRRRIHARVFNLRNDNHHRPPAAIAKSTARVVAETLNVAGVMLDRRLARTMADAGMSGFLTKQF